MDYCFASVFNIDIVFFSKSKTCRLTALSLTKAIRTDRTETFTNANLTYFRLVFFKQLFCVHNQTVFNLQRIPSSENPSLIRPLIRIGFDELLIEDIVPRDTIVHAFRF